MKTRNFKRNLAALFALAISGQIAPTYCFAIGPGGLTVGFARTVADIVNDRQILAPLAGISQQRNRLIIDNINTRGFALRRDGAY